MIVDTKYHGMILPKCILNISGEKIRLTTPDVKQLNKERIREVLIERSVCMKAVLARNADLSVTTCNTPINEMLADGEITVVDQEENLMGRPAVRYAYNKNFHHVMGINLENMLSQRTDIPVEVRNDMDFLAWGMYKERVDGKDTLVALYYPIANGSPRGSGSVINGRLLRGATKFSDELTYLCKLKGNLKVRTKQDLPGKQR